MRYRIDETVIEFRNNHFDIMLNYCFSQKAHKKIKQCFYNSFPNPEAHNVNYASLIRVSDYKIRVLFLVPIGHLLNGA